jgi:vancomycin resistance protein YoaR
MKIEILSALKKPYVVLLAGTFVIVAFGVGAVFASAATFKNFSPEFYIAGVNVGGKTLADSEREINKKIAKISQGITVNIPGMGSRIIHVPPTAIDVESTLEHAKNVASRDALTRTIRDSLGFAQRTDVEFSLALLPADVITDGLIASWELPLTSATNAQFAFSEAGVTVVPSANGQHIDQDQLVEALEKALATGESQIVATIVEMTPEITTEQAESLKGNASAIMSEITKGRTLKIKDKTFALTASDLIALLQPRVADGDVVVGIDAEFLKSKLGKQLAIFEQESKNAEFEYDGKKVLKFQPHQLGIQIDWEVLSKDLFASLSTKENSVVVVTKDAEPKIKIEDLNSLGLKEMIGTGRSEFAGSPKNRIHNITTGMNSLKNILIAPGETFSLMKALGPIDGTTGYLEELVIKDNKTLPEFGGGLCQIGTTTFRAAMGAGFPIVERRNHSYQVAYYFENGVSGTDATIYDPKPDFRFKNDTAHWVLLDPHLKGTTLDFYFWGTSDGRKASRTIPKKLATQPAPPKKEIPTTTLPPGKVKCTEKAHAGATMLFTYTVEYPDGTVKKEDFQSYYKPWAEVCLIGVAATSSPAGDPNLSAPISPDAAGTPGN